MIRKIIFILFLTTLGNHLSAETVAYNDYIELGGESASRDAGKLRQEGKEYVVKDGDVMHFLFNV